MAQDKSVDIYECLPVRHQKYQDSSQWCNTIRKIINCILISFGLPHFVSGIIRVPPTTRAQFCKWSIGCTLMSHLGKLLALKSHQKFPLGHVTMILYWSWIWSTVGFLWPPVARQMVHYDQKRDVCQERVLHLSGHPWATDVALIWRLLVLLRQ